MRVRRTRYRGKLDLSSSLTDDSLVCNEPGSNVPHETLYELGVFVLLAYAQVAATLTGFIGVVFILGERAQGRFNQHESSTLFHFMFAGLGTLFISLFVALLLVTPVVDEHLAWRLANGLSGLFHLIGASRLTLERWTRNAGAKRVSIAAVTGLAMAGRRFAPISGLRCLTCPIRGPMRRMPFKTG